jgi:hypothetical protein
VVVLLDLEQPYREQVLEQFLETLLLVQLVIRSRILDQDVVPVAL